MLKIRLRKPGKSIKRRYHYKIVVTEAKSARESKFTAQLGHYDPSRELLKFDIVEYEAWIKKGAKPTETVAALFKKYKRQNKKIEAKTKTEAKKETKAKAKAETKADTKAETKAEGKTETKADTKT